MPAGPEHQLAPDTSRSHGRVEPPHDAASHVCPLRRDGERVHAAPAGERPPSRRTATEWVTLNVGGRLFTTSLATLTGAEPQSMLARSAQLCSTRVPSAEPAQSWR